MLDGIHTCAQRCDDAGGAVSMSRHLQAMAARLLDNRHHLGRAELLCADVLFEGQHTGSRHDLDHARAVFDLLAYGFDALVGPIRNAAQRRRAQQAVMKAPRVPVTARDGNGVARGNDARPDEVPAIDGLHQSHIDKVIATHLAHCGEAGAQRDGRMLGTAQGRVHRPFRSGTQRRLCVQLVGQVGMAVDQPRQQGALTQIHDARALRGNCGRPHGLNAIADHDDFARGVMTAVLDIHDARGAHMHLCQRLDGHSEHLRSRCFGHG